jgi:hypothetical protein
MGKNSAEQQQSFDENQVEAAASSVPARRSRKKSATVIPLTAADLSDPAQDSVSDLVPVELAQFLATNEAEGKQQFQRSLDLFGEGAPITESRNDLVLKKSSQRIRFETSLTVLQRKLLNAFIFVARPTMSQNDTFRVPVDYLSWCVGHDRADMGYLKESIRGMKKTIEVKQGEKWAMTSLLADVSFDGKDIVYQVPPIARAAFGAPKRYYYISMVVNSRFKSKYAHTLYEMLKEFEYRGETPMMSVDEFRERMSVEKHEYLEFKRLSVRTITGPLQELEELSDFTATVEYDTRGRKTIGLKFIIKPNPKNRFSPESGERIRPEYWTMLKDDFGLNRTQLDELTRAYIAERIEEVCDVLYYRYVLKNKEMKHGYRLLTSALQDTEDKYHLTNREKAELQLVRDKRQKVSLHDELRAAQAHAHASKVAQFSALWASWSEAQQQSQWTAFLGAPERASLPARILKTTTPDLSHPMVSAALMNFLMRTGELGE